MHIRPIYRQDYGHTGKTEPKAVSPVGYTVQQGLTVTITNLASFEEISSGLTKQGVNNMHGVSFQTSDLRKHRDEARLKAVQHAKEKAQAMAGQLGASLMSVHSIYEHPEERFRSQQQSQQMIAVPGPSEGSVGIGQIKIKAGVNIVFRLKTTDLSP